MLSVYKNSTIQINTSMKTGMFIHGANTKLKFMRLASWTKYTETKY